MTTLPPPERTRPPMNTDAVPANSPDEEPEPDSALAAQRPRSLGCLADPIGTTHPALAPTKH